MQPWKSGCLFLAALYLCVLLFEKRCPDCGKFKLAMTGRANDEGEYEFECTVCEHQVWKQPNIPRSEEVG